MRLMIDEQTFDIAERSVRAALNRAAEIAQDQGRVIIEVHVDGTRWSDTQITSADMGGLEAETVALTSAAPKELVTSTLGDALLALEEIETFQSKAADALGRDELGTAMESLGIALKLWTEIERSVTLGASILGIDLKVEISSIGSGEDAVEQLSKSLKSLRDAIIIRNPVVLTDTLAYEMPGVVSQWRGLLQGLQERWIRGES